MRNAWNNKACSAILFFNKVWQNVKTKVQWRKESYWNLATNHKREWQKLEWRVKLVKYGKNSKGLKSQNMVKDSNDELKS